MQKQTKRQLGFEQNQQIAGIPPFLAVHHQLDISNGRSSCLGANRTAITEGVIPAAVI
jgi:hypothetical protein